ncbi:uncharacterized protein TRAVEDRAFT_67709 [Trametes versicolor FP-101664 SS1]|uniref:F-box domain-containing protein n=1 Tax=Trametes versicolor (strain FP-101664) TaxID=717944 RepID=R7S6K4_TRAVS|nr:uncharacterized protein TRAVEDRAFT_67709 [Trametes versicolor FP-101664 SS1]EIW51536.1 hypothetical protein TRAVEDRAFT_67709 [Trametes versicolor FP-101664 SS1]
MSLLDLSHELLVHILSYLEYEHLQVSRRLNHAMDRLIQSSILLQYSMQLQLYGYEDNPSCHLVISDKLRLLRQQESAWSRLDFEKETTIRIPFNPSSIYDLTDGVLLLGESVSGIQTGADTVRWTRLSQLVSSEDAPAVHFWEKIDVGAHIIDVGLSVEEHDLIVVATDRETEDNHTKFELRLIQLSTGLNHPLAAKPLIPLAVIEATPQSIAGNCSVCIEIVGDLLGFLFHYPAGYTRPPAMFEVYNWKTGQCLELRGLDCPCYSTFTFLSPDVIALPNCAENTIELCRIESTTIDGGPQQLQTACVLQLPTLSSGHTIAQVTCRSEPKMTNTTRNAPAFRSSEPFHLKPADAVVIFNIMTHDSQGFHECLTLIVHTAALLRILATQVAQNIPDIVPEVLPSPFAPPPAPEEDTDEASGLPWPALIDGTSPEPDPEPASTCPRIAWAQWGPNVCRWLEASFGASRWITTTCGQRYVTVEEDPIDDDLMRSTIVVYDFNPHNVRRLAAQHRKRRRCLRGYPRPSEQPVMRAPLPAPLHFPLPEVVVQDEGTVGPHLGLGLAVMGGAGVAAGGPAGETDGPLVGVSAARLEHASLIPFTDPATRVIGQIQCEPTELMAGYALQYRIFDEPVRTALPFAQLSSFKTYAYGAVLLDRSMVIGVKLNDADDIKELVIHPIRRGK